MAVQPQSRSEKADPLASSLEMMVEQPARPVMAQDGLRVCQYEMSARPHVMPVHYKDIPRAGGVVESAI